MTYALNFFLLVLPFYKCVLTIYAVLVWAFNTVTLTCALGYTSMLRNNVRSRALGSELVVVTVLSIAASWRWWEKFLNCSFSLYFSEIYWEPSEMSEGVTATLLLPFSLIFIAAFSFCCFFLQNPSQEMPSIMVISDFFFISERSWNHWSWALSYTYISSGTCSCSRGCWRDKMITCAAASVWQPFSSITLWVYALTLHFSVCCNYILFSVFDWANVLLN